MRRSYCVSRRDQRSVRSPLIRVRHSGIAPGTFPRTCGDETINEKPPGLPTSSVGAPRATIAGADERSQACALIFEAVRVAALEAMRHHQVPEELDDARVVIAVG